MNKIYINHKDWEGTCIIKDKIIYRERFINESGTYHFTENKLIIYWTNWEPEEFYSFDNNKILYLKELFQKKYNIYYFLEMNNEIKIFIDKENNKYIFYYLKKNIGNCFIENNSISIYDNYGKIKKYNKYIEDYYIFEEDENIFYNLYNQYIFNIYLKKYYSISNIENNVENIFINNLSLIYPKKIIINNKIIFSNITLCNGKIIFTSCFYKYEDVNLDHILIIPKNNKIKNKKIFKNNHYESSYSLIIELEKYVNSLFIVIKYNNEYSFNLFLEDYDIEKNNIYAMTLFKDDYLLLKRYFKYYCDLGIDHFFLYYNSKINKELIDSIIQLNEYNVKIYLLEWDYPYWLKYSIDQQHCAQSMAINDSLHILKNYCKYILYNDLDEYIILKENFNTIIENNKEVDVFIFKNRFCKMGNKLISFEEFDMEFDLSNVIKGNYWEEQREKNLIKVDNVNVMGVHYPFQNFSEKVLNKKITGEFYHFINFKNKNREILMTEYIT